MADFTVKLKKAVLIKPSPTLLPSNITAGTDILAFAHHDKVSGLPGTTVIRKAGAPPLPLYVRLLTRTAVWQVLLYKSQELLNVPNSTTDLAGTPLKV